MGALQVVLAFLGTEEAQDQHSNLEVSSNMNELSTDPAAKYLERSVRGVCGRSRTLSASTSSDVSPNPVHGRQHSGWRKSWQSVKEVVFLQVRAFISLIHPATYFSLPRTS